jgi:hypothetical protein
LHETKRSVHAPLRFVHRHQHVVTDVGRLRIADCHRSALCEIGDALAAPLE